MTPFISYTDMKPIYPIQVIDLRFQVALITPKKLNSWKNIETAHQMLDILL